MMENYKRIGAAVILVALAMVALTVPTTTALPPNAPGAPEVPMPEVYLVTFTGAATGQWTGGELSGLPAAGSLQATWEINCGNQEGKVCYSWIFAGVGVASCSGDNWAGGSGLMVLAESDSATECGMELGTAALALCRPSGGASGAVLTLQWDAIGACSVSQQALPG